MLPVFLLLTFVRCNVESPEPNPPVPPVVQEKIKITVLEKDTKKPVSGVMVSLLRCSKSDFEFGCTGYAIAATLMTNPQGEIEYYPISGIVAMQTSHPDYWAAYEKGASGELLISPNGYVMIHLEKTGTYSLESYAIIEARGDCFSFECPYPYTSLDLGLPMDTTFVFKVKAAEKTSIYWRVLAPPSYYPIKSGSSQPFVVDRFDTLSMNIQY